MKITYHHEIKPKKKISNDEIVDLILKTRKIKDKELFLQPKNPAEINLEDFGFKKEIKKTVEVLKKIKEEGKMIVVYTDYDADGITGGAILWETLHLLGFKAMPYVPHRQLEGYGFSKKGIDNIKKEFDPALIISVDHGITAAEKISYAKSFGIPVIVTDHHLKPKKMPEDALAIFHIPSLSGSGVSYFFSKMIFDFFGNKNSSSFHLLTSNFSSDYLSLSAIGSIADLVPLLGETRSVVKYGLEACSKTKRHGLTQIMKEAAIYGKRVTPYEVGFIIAPRINAVGRLEHALDALRLLCTTDEKKAFSLASKVGKLNSNRQDLVKTAVEEAKKMVERTNVNFPVIATPRQTRGKQSSFRKTFEFPKLLILKSPQNEEKRWHEGIIGLISSKITEKYTRPSIVLTKSDGFYKASARSTGSFHMTDFLRSLKKHLVDVGGHAGAAGFTIEEKNLEKFIKEARKKAEKEIKEKDLVRSIETDIKIPLSLANLSLAKKLEALEPFGVGNPKPVFYSQGRIVNKKTFGKKNEYLRIYLKESKEDFPLEMISFNGAVKDENVSLGDEVSCTFSLDINRWNGKESVQAKLITLFKEK